MNKLLWTLAACVICIAGCTKPLSIMDIDGISPVLKDHKKNDIIDTSELNPIYIKTHIEPATSHTPSLDFVNAESSLQLYSCNPYNIVQNDPYFRCDLGRQTQSLLQDSRLKDRTFQIYRYDLQMTDSPDQLMMIQTGLQSFTLLTGSIYDNRKNLIIRDHISDMQERVILTSSDIVFHGSYIPAGQIIHIKVVGKKPLYHTVTSSGSYNRYPYVASRNLSDDVTPRMIPTHGTLFLQSYRRNHISIPIFDTLFASGVTTQVLPVASGILISYQGLKPNTTYHIKGSAETQVFDYQFNTFAPFALTVSKNITKHPLRGDKYQESNDQYDNNYHLCANQPWDADSVRQSLDHSIGSGNYTMVLSTQEQTYQTRWGTTGETSQNYCMMMYYYLDPTRTHTFELKNMRSVFGETLDTKITIAPHQISTQHRYASIVGNVLNILPLGIDTYRHIQYTAKNITGIELTYQACELIDHISFLSNVQTHQTVSQEELLGQMIKCNTPQYKQLTLSGFQRWKDTVGQIDLNMLFSGQIPQIFKIGLDGANKYFLSTNIGIIAKYTPGMLHVWTTDIKDGTLLTGVQVQVGYLSGSGDISDLSMARMVVQTGIVNGYGYFVLPILQGINQIGYVQASHHSDQTLIVYPDSYLGFSLSGGQAYSMYSNNFVIDPYHIGAGYGYQTIPWKLYAYTDRVLYKAGDQVFVAGWIRQPHSDIGYTGDLTVTIVAPDGNTVMTQNITGVDSFGGFHTSYQLGDKVSFGTYRIDYYTKESSYSSYFTIQEYKKSNYYIDTIPLVDPTGGQYVRLKPLYYRGDELKSYDIKLDYTIKGQHYGIYDRQTDSDMPWYYAKVWGEDISFGGSFVSTGQTKPVDIPLQSNVSFVSTMDMSMMMTDPTNQELVYKTLSQTLYPNYLVGIQGWDYDWIDSRKMSYRIHGKLLQFDQDRGDILQNYKLAADSQIRLLTYYKDFNPTQVQGPDQQRYYADEAYAKIDESVVNTDDGIWSYDVNITKPGKYFVRAIYQSGYETQKTIVAYDRGLSMYGDPSNNFKLGIFVKDKEYKIGEAVEVQIEPYIKGATAIITIEKDGHILYQESKILDGNPIVVYPKQDRYPNAHISVIQLMGSDLNIHLSQHRTEPRFMIGYQKIKLDPLAFMIQYDIQISDMSGKVLDHYQPGQKIQLQIQAKDIKGKPLKARLSVGIVDKGLIDLYDQIKKPLESFYIDSMPGFSIISNLKLIYQSLRVFSADGTKGGGGGEGSQGPLVLSPRTKFRDLAFRRGGAVTDDQGYLSLTTMLPDNLTTWVVEVIGVGQKGQMGAERSYFTVTKDVVLNANLPQFVGYQDRIVVPLSLTVNNPKYHHLIPTGFVSFNGQKKSLTIQDRGSGSYQTIIDMKDWSPIDFLSNTGLLISLQAGEQEHIIQYIPVRSEGLTHHMYQSRYDNILDTRLKPLGSISQGDAIFTVSTLPIQVTSNAIHYLISYPYGCLEQTLSSLYTLLLAHKLDKAGIDGVSYFSGDQVMINHQTQPWSKIIADTLDVLSKYYHTDDGLYKFRPGDKSDYELSVYVYQTLSLIKSMGYKVDDDLLLGLEKKLNMQTDPYLRLYYLLYRSMYHNIDINQVKEYLKKPIDPAMKILVYTTLAYQSSPQNDLIPEIESFLSGSQVAEIGGAYTPFIDKDILRSIYVRGLMRNMQRDKVGPHMIYFHRSVNTEGIRGGSTQKNMQILAMMSDYLLSQYTTLSGGVDVKMTIGDKVYTMILDSKKPSHTIHIPFINTQDIPLTVSASRDIMIDYDLDYIPQNPLILQDERHGVKNLGITYSGMDVTNIGDIVTATAHFHVSQKAHQVAVVYPIPSSYKIINPQLLQKKESDDYFGAYYDQTAYIDPQYQVQFTNIGTSRDRYSCTPTHYEMRFDQLFLYYNQLEQGAGCKIQFHMIRTHDGQSSQAPLRLREMYLTNVRATKR